MIQRIQTIYLVLSSILSGGIIFVFSLWKQNETEMYALDLLSSESLLLKSIPILFLCSSVLALITIFLFKNRKLQFVLNRINILINLFLIGLLVYNLLILSGQNKVSEKGLTLFIPILLVLLLVFANKAIHKDENLVKSVDRLR